MKGILKLREINENNDYERDLKKYDGQEVSILNEYEDTYEVEMKDTSEYTVFKDEVIFNV